MPVAQPGHHRRPPARPSPPAARSASIRRDRLARWPPRPRSPCAPPQPRQDVEHRRRRRRPAGASRPRRPARPGRAARRRTIEAEVDGLDARCSTSAHGVMPRWFNGRDGRSRRAGRAGPNGARPARQARPRARSSGSAPTSTATTPRSSPHGDGYLVVCGEAISPPFLLADPFGAGAAAVVTNVSDVRAMGGRPLALVDMLVAPDQRARRAACSTASRWAADQLGVPDRRRPPHARPPAGALGLVHRRSRKRPLRASAAEPGDVAARRLRDSTAGT